MSEWIGIDLDGTLAFYKDYRGPGHIGPPIPKMLKRVKGWLSRGKDVRLFTARMSGRGNKTFLKAWRKWSKKHLGQVLPATCEKDRHCKEIWDDKATGVKFNSGSVVETYRRVLQELQVSM